MVAAGIEEDRLKKELNHEIILQDWENYYSDLDSGYSDAADSDEEYLKRLEKDPHDHWAEWREEYL